MSKHKHFHNIKNTMQILQHSRRERIGPMDPGRTRPKRKTAPGVTSTQDGKETQQDH